MTDAQKTQLANLVTAALDDLGPTRADQCEHVIRRTAKAAYDLGAAHALQGLMTADEVAARLGISSRMVRNRATRLNAHGVPVGFRTGGVWFFCEADLPNLRGGPIGTPVRRATKP